MNKIAISSAIGVGAALALGGAYVGAPYAGLNLTPAMVLVAAAVVAFGSTAALFTISLLTATEKKKPRLSRELRDLGPDDFERFPVGGVRLVLKPDSVIDEFDVVRNPNTYADRDIMVVIKKSSRKIVFNPIHIKRLFDALSGFSGFRHLLLVNEYDEFIGYIPAGYVRRELLQSADAESLIVKYIINVLMSPPAGEVLREIKELREISGLSVYECISDDERVSNALKKVTEGLFRGLVVFKDKRNRKPVGVIWSERLVKLALQDLE